MTDGQPTLPTWLAKRFVRYMVGFGVAVAIGMAPFLGTLDLPLFAPLLAMFPDSLRGTAIPLSSFVMGLVAIAVQFAAGEVVSRKGLRRWFVRTLVLIVGGVVLLLVLYSELVTVIPDVAKVDGEGTRYVALVTGLSRQPHCTCEPTLSDAACIREIGFANVAACWGDAQVRRSGLALTLVYLLLMGGFGALVGLLLLQEKGRRQGKAPGKG